MANAIRWTEEQLAAVRARQPQAVVLPPPKVTVNGKPKKAAKALPAPNPAMELFAIQLKVAGIAFEREYRFHSTRRWRFDFMIDDTLAVEIDGGLFVNGGHSRGRARIGDMERDAEAMLLGFRVLRAPPEWVKDGTLIRYVKELTA